MAMVKDPVCGMAFDTSQAVSQTTYQGQAYYFCSEECRRTVEENPAEFVATMADQDRGSAAPVDRPER